MVDPYFSIFWSQDIPRVVDEDEAGRKATVTVVAGTYGKHAPPEPPPDSWANNPKNDVAIWTISVEEGRTWLLPKTKDTSTRTLYFFSGQEVRIEGKEWSEHSVFLLRPDVDVRLEALSGDARFLVLQGRPIGQPVAQHGPFVMNTRAEIQQAMIDYQRTQYGGWPWDRQGPHHGADRGRFAKKPDGSVEEFPRREV
jgi:redox-sensitive bicupin YhaK (pirin superfamily)